MGKKNEITTKLKRIQVDGFKSICKLDLEFGNVNVMIGGNGAGKSNFVMLFKLLNFMTTEGLQTFVSRSGGSNSLLHLGVKNTLQIRVNLEFADSLGREQGYMMRLTDAAPDTLIYSEERIAFKDRARNKDQDRLMGSGHRETQLPIRGEKGGEITAQVVLRILKNCRIFQFHDTSDTAYIRRKGSIDNNYFLYSDGGNLAAFLNMLHLSYPEYYSRIVDSIKLVFPYFGDFDLSHDRINNSLIMLKWYEAGSDYIFGPHQISDGLLRFIALATLLLQPPKFLPNLIVIDEPELGLHPYAINVLASLIREASQYSQIILATQSETLVDQFEAKDIIVVNRKGSVSEFSRLDEKELEEWLQNYSVSELWAKNVISGRP